MMPMEQIVIRSVSGYIFMVPGMILYFWQLKKAGRKQTLFHRITAFIFCYYLIGILTTTGIQELSSFSPRIVIIPFLDMIRGPVDTMLNIVLFLPLGFFLPLLYQSYNRVNRVIVTGSLLSCAIEFFQMFGMGATDINDFITNTVGTLLGFYIYKFFSKFTQKELCKKFQMTIGNAYKELIFFVIYAFVVMVTIQPYFISCVFHLG